MFRRYGEVEPTDPTVVGDVFRCLHQVLLKGRATHIGISMELKQSFGQIDVVQPTRGKKVLKDLPESPLFHQGVDVETRLGHDLF
jgi:hypothetical protein